VEKVVDVSVASAIAVPSSKDFGGFSGRVANVVDEAAVPLDGWVVAVSARFDAGRSFGLGGFRAELDGKELVFSGLGRLLSVLEGSSDIVVLVDTLLDDLGLEASSSSKSWFDTNTISSRAYSC